MAKEKIHSENKNIEGVVFNCFLRVIKDRNRYKNFRCGVRNPSIVRGILGKGKLIATPFSDNSSSESVATTLRNLSKQYGMDSAFGDKYEHVTVVINHLLHYFLEQRCSIPVLTDIGEDVYELSCFRLFGDEIESEDIFTKRPQVLSFGDKSRPSWYKEQANQSQGYVLGETY